MKDQSVKTDMLIKAATALRTLNTNHNDVGDGTCVCCKEAWPCDVSVVVVTISQLMSTYAP